jgi:uncharacterized protein (DUF885 family)
MKRSAVGALLWLAFVPATFTPLPTPAAEAVRRAGDTYFRWLQEDRLDIRMRLGLPIERLPDVSLEKLSSDASRAESLERSLAEVDAAALDHDDALSLDVLKRRLREMREAPRFYWLTFDVTPYASPMGPIEEAFARWAFATPADAERYRRVLSQYPDFLRTLGAKVEAQASRRIRISRDELDVTIASIRSRIAPPEKSPYAVAPARLAALPAETGSSFGKETAALIETKVNPALAALADFLAGDYRQRAPASVGLSQYPEGRAYYEWLVPHHTTLEKSPEEIHRIGLDEVARLDARMDEVQKRVGFSGTRAEFRESLRKNPRFYPATPDEVGRTLLRYAARIEPEMPAWFARKPKAPYTVKRLAPTLEGGQTFGYYTPPTRSDPTGYYFYNGSDLPHRSLLGAAHLTYHELVPGHHFQINLAYEDEALPAFRRESMDTAYTEGWAEYAATVAGEMGMYSDPYDLYGQLAMETFIATRLVVDTGMNALGWPRERAVAFMRDHEMETDQQIRTESLRYCCDIPGQALGYRLGHIQIRELRERARAALGQRFDIRRFHDAVLSSGSLPLTTLAKHVDWFIEREKARR